MTAKRHPPRRPLDTVPRERSAYAHDVAHCRCGGLLSFGVDPLTGVAIATCGTCHETRGIRRTGGLIACADCGADRAGATARMVDGQRTSKRCDAYCARCCKRHAAEGHTCPRTQWLARKATYNARAVLRAKGIPVPDGRRNRARRAA